MGRGRGHERAVPLEGRSNPLEASPLLSGPARVHKALIVRKAVVAVVAAREQVVVGAICVGTSIVRADQIAPMSPQPTLGPLERIAHAHGDLHPWRKLEQLRKQVHVWHIGECVNACCDYASQHASHLGPDMGDAARVTGIEKDGATSHEKG